MQMCIRDRRHGDHREDDHHPEVEAAEEFPDLFHHKQHRVAGNVPLGNQVHRADDLAREAEGDGAHHIALLDGGGHTVGQVEGLLGDGADVYKRQ